MRHFWHPVAYSKDVAEGQMVSGKLLGGAHPWSSATRA